MNMVKGYVVYFSDFTAECSILKACFDLDSLIESGGKYVEEYSVENQNENYLVIEDVFGGKKFLLHKNIESAKRELKDKFEKEIDNLRNMVDERAKQLKKIVEYIDKEFKE